MLFSTWSCTKHRNLSTMRAYVRKNIHLHINIVIIPNPRGLYPKNFSRYVNMRVISNSIYTVMTLWNTHVESIRKLHSNDAVCAETVCPRIKNALNAESLNSNKLEELLKEDEIMILTSRKRNCTILIIWEKPFNILSLWLIQTPRKVTHRAFMD